MATLVACLTIFGSGFVVMVLVPSLSGMVIAVAIMAVGNGLGAGVNMTIGADLSPAIRRARFLGIWAIFSNGGKLGGPALISLVITLASLRFGILFPDSSPSSARCGCSSGPSRSACPVECAEDKPSPDPP